MALAGRFVRGFAVCRTQFKPRFFPGCQAEYWKWKGPAPVSWFNGGYVTDPAELQDLNRLQQTGPDVE